MPADVPSIVLKFVAGLIRREGQQLKRAGQQLLAVAKLIRDLESAGPTEPTLPAPSAPTLRVIGRDPNMAPQFFVGVTPSPAADPSITFDTVDLTVTVTPGDGSPATTLPVISSPFGSGEIQLPGSYPAGTHIGVVEVQKTADGRHTLDSPAASSVVVDPTVINATPAAPTIRVIGVDPATVPVDPTVPTT